MESFFSTLAQTTAAFLGILAASVAAYYIFLQDKTAQYDLRIEESQMQVRAVLLDLRKSWLPSFAHSLPFDFGDIYRSRHPGKSQIELARQVAFDFAFNDPLPYKIVSELNKKYGLPDLPWRGRVAFWALTEFVSVMTGGPLDTRTKPQGVFPLALAPGFDEWRRDLQSLADVVSIFQFHQPELVQDFNAYAKATGAVRLPEYSAPALTGLFASIERITGVLNEIDKLSVLKTQYAFARRVQGRWLVVLGGLSLLVGVVLPLLFLAFGWSKSVTPIGATTVLLATLICTLGAILLLARDLATQPATAKYVRVRWLVPMLEELAEVRKQIEIGGLIDSDFFSDVLLREDRGSLSQKVHGALQRLCDSARRYNTVASRLSEKTANTLSSDDLLGRIFVRPWTAGGSGPILSPANFIDRAKVDDAVASLKTNSTTYIAVEMPLNRGAQSIGGFSATDLRASPKAMARISDLRVVLSASGEARSFEVERDQLRVEALTLEAAIREKL